MSKSLDHYINTIRQSLDEKKGGNIVVYHLKGSSLTDYVIIVSANNDSHCQALIQDITSLSSENHRQH